MVLWIGCFNNWLARLTHLQVNPQTWTGCRFGYFFFLFYFGRHYSSVLLVLMSLEKCFAVYFPLKAKTVCIVKTAKRTSGIVGVMLAGYDSIYIFITESFNCDEDGLGLCVYNVDFKVISILDSLDSVLYSFGPFLLMFVTNFAIVFKFMIAKCKSNSTESTIQALSKAATRGTAMVVTVSVTFLILTAPTALHMALMFVIQESDKPMYVVLLNVT